MKTVHCKQKPSFFCLECHHALPHVFGSLRMLCNPVGAVCCCEPYTAFSDIKHLTGDRAVGYMLRGEDGEALYDPTAWELFGREGWAIYICDTETPGV